MAVNSINAAATSEVYAAYGKTDTKATKPEASTKKAESGVVYEKASTAADSKKGAYKVSKMSAEDRAALVQQLKEEQESRQKNLMNIVEQMMGKQAQTSNLASMFSPENLRKVSPEAIAQAKKDVAEDGYYGVKQTSQRMFDFASALAGDDVDKMKKMEAAMEKGFKKAAAAWGTDLPQISQDTMTAARQLFADYYASKEVQA